MAELMVDEHGGSCCGIQHIHNFYSLGETLMLSDKIKEINNAINDVIDEYDQEDRLDEGCWRAGCEIVLASYQLSDWREAVEAVGFKEVFSFINSNSDNRCHVFYFATNSEGDRA